MDVRMTVKTFPIDDENDDNNNVDLGSISSTFYVQLLRLQIPKA